MEEKDIDILSREGCYTSRRLQGKVEETHISWVILTPKWAFKIKKPLQLNFLDFSTLELRKQYCEREVELNSRFSSIYLDVLPVRKANDDWWIGGEKGELVDYAVRMKRLQTAKKMDLMLRHQKVTDDHITALARKVAAFHQKANIIQDSFSLEKARNLFNDLKGILPEVEQELEASYAEMVRQGIDWSDAFLQAHQNRMRERVQMGHKRDLHGDLHSGNIFLYRVPVIFDCIEFNEQFRYIDLLYEVAFLCMDLEAFGKERLANIFLNNYLRDMPCMDTREDAAIFIYYKCLRANVRAKVHAISAQQEKKEGHKEEAQRHWQEVKKYLNLMVEYRENKG